MQHMGQRKRRRRRILPGLLLLLAILVVGLLLGLWALHRTGWGMGPDDLLSQPLPAADSTEAAPPESALITVENYFETQGLNQCGGYSAAYLLRFFGQEVTGETAYEGMGHKLPNGYLLPVGISDFLERAGHPAAFLRSSVGQLRQHVSEGIPVIVLIGQGLGWQHYATVVGYDSENFYLYDSLKQTVDDNPHYNRIIDAAYFEQLWNNGLPFFERVCFVVEDQESV